MKRAIVMMTLLGACQSPSAPSTFGVNVTVDASMLASSIRPQIRTAALSVTGDETYKRNFDISSAIAGGQVRFRYIPAIQNGSLTLAVDALGSDGTLLAHAEPRTVVITAGHSVDAALTFGSKDGVDMATDPGDGGTPCEPGSHLCGGSCVDDHSVATCGNSCTTCPITANASAATCDGTSCGLQCNSGYHPCNGACLSSTDANSCNMSCTACTPPTGGSASCDGASCGGTCPNGEKLCFGNCIAMNLACNGSCPSGTHECTGNCFDNGSVNSCGMSCMPCPVPANATVATCTSGACGFTCTNGYKPCGGKCIPNSGCCVTSDCTQPSNGVASCDTNTNVCSISCNTTFMKCGAACIPSTACCSNANCPPPTGGTAICNVSHACVATCNMASYTACGGACVDTTSDNSNCGGCGIPCGGQCTNSRCLVVLASGQTAPSGIAVDGTYVYWTNGGTSGAADGSIMRLPIGGGTPVPLTTGLAGPGLIVVDANSLYWLNSGTLFGSGSVARMARGGGAVASFATSQTQVSGITLDGTNVYWTNANNPNNASSVGTVQQVPLNGGTVVPVTTGGSCKSPVVDGSYVYWIDSGNSSIMKTPIGGGTSTPVATSQAIPSYLTIYGGSLYWTNYGTFTVADGTIMTVSTTGGAPAPVETGLPGPLQIVVDATSMYWTQSPYMMPGAGFKKAARSGGPITTIVDSPLPSSFVVDGTSIYWTLAGANQVVKATPK